MAEAKSFVNDPSGYTKGAIDGAWNEGKRLLTTEQGNGELVPKVVSAILLKKAGGKLGRTKSPGGKSQKSTVGENKTGVSNPVEVPFEDVKTPPLIYREGNPSPGNLTARAIDEGNLSFRDSLSNPFPLKEGQRPVFRPNQPYFSIDTSKLPADSVIPDNKPPGHVSVKGVSPEVLKDAVSERGKFPKKDETEND